MRKLLIAFVLSVLSSLPAFANWTGKDATPATITFYNPGACISVVCVPVVQLTDGTNQVTLTTVGADDVSNTLTGLPVYARNVVWNGTTWDRWTGAVTVASLPLPSGAATAANQSTEIGSLGTIATNSATQATAANQATGNASLAAIAAAAVLPLPAQTGFGVNIGAAQLIDASSNAALVDPCQSGVKTYTPINIVTAANTKIVAGTASKKTYLCGLFLYPGATDNIAIVEGSGTNCGTSPLGLIGGNTAATGIIATAQAGFVLPTTGYAHAASTVNANDFCLITSAGVQLSGVAVTVAR